MNTTEILELGREHMDLHGLLDQGWSVVDDSRAKRRGGQCRYDKREIGLSATHLLSQWPREEVLDVILHEIAHAKVGPGHGHGATWKRMAEQVGASPTRCYSRGLPKADHKWVGECIEGHEFSQLRAPGAPEFCAKGDCRSKGFSNPARAIDWRHVDTGERPRGKGYAKNFRIDWWNKFREAYADGVLPEMWAAPEDPLLGYDDADDFDSIDFAADLRCGYIDPLVPEQAERLSEIAHMAGVR